MQEKELRERIKSASLSGCFLLAGEEDYLKRYYLGEIRKTVVTDEGFAPFNHIIFDSTEMTMAALADAVKAPPMFADLKLVEWRYPALGKMKESEMKALEEILDTLPDYDYTVIAMIVAADEIDLGTEKRPSKIARRLGERMNVINFERSGDTQLLAWLKRHFDKEGIAVTRECLEAMIFRSGRSMDVLHREVEKLSAYLKANGRDALNVTDVTEVCSSTPESDTFALSNAILDRNKRAAFAALDEMKRQRLDPTVIVGMMAKTYSELCTVVSLKDDGTDVSEIESVSGIHPYKVKSYVRAARLFKPGAPAAILGELSRVDVGMKFGGVTGYTAIEMFISKCL